MTPLVPGAIVGAIVLGALGAKRTYDQKQRERAAAPPKRPGT